MRKKLRLLAIGVALYFAFVMSGCPQPIANAEFAGTWYLTGPMGGGDTLTFSNSGMNENTHLFVIASWMDGTMSMNIVAYDEAANHIRGVVTNVTGTPVLNVPTGTTIYITYSITGNEFRMDLDTTAYPATGTSNGPWVKQ